MGRKQGFESQASWHNEPDAARRGAGGAAKGEEQRVALRRRCPFIANGICVIYPVRPLACRGHASHDKRTCVEAAAGCAGSIPFSAPHRTVRSLVQNAMQSALREAGYAFGAYELNQAVALALMGGDHHGNWAAGIVARRAVNKPCPR